MNQTPTALALENAIERLYTVFGKYPLHDRVVGCPCCVSDEDTDQLHSKPLRELSSDDLSRYAFKAITTWGSETEFKHFLPRLLELVTDDHSIVTEVDCQMLFGKLEYTTWHLWPQPERDAVEDYFIALWRFLLEESPQYVTIDDYLCGIAQAVDDTAPYLSLWQELVLSSAVSHFLDFLDWNSETLRKRTLSNAFWSQRRQQMSQAVSWTLDPMVSQRFAENLEACVHLLRIGQ